MSHKIYQIKIQQYLVVIQNSDAIRDSLKSGYIIKHKSIMSNI